MRRLRGVIAKRELCDADAHVTHHTSHVTRHTSHVTRHTSHVTHHTTSHVTRHNVTRPSWQGYELRVLEGAGNLSRVAQVMLCDPHSSCSWLVVYFSSERV
jgi:hypothetical protein